MIKCFSSILISFLSLLLPSCSGRENYKQAFGYQINGYSYIKVKGKRPLVAHDPGSVLSNKQYEDSLLLQVPSLGNGTIDGKDIPVEQGSYKYIGTITIREGKLHINLRYDNTDDRKVEPLSWNGEYILENY
jgi:hypothetical protein